MIRFSQSIATGSILALLAIMPCPASAATQSQPARSWSGTKCIRYTAAWSQTIARGGTKGLGLDFLSRHDAFLASGCTGPHNVCPRSPEELKLANDMVVLAMNAGTASTFPPFGCGR
ncbi:hypothetical protein [Lichenihabitans psoromatis]|uniref:hypothetical protein n=1 Tax=Lichenihabitans psoromatis TaxID=2528642 RepID=UPI001036204E|nr:hypothetical protein [Lichenihabitans psoromatis]